MNTLIDELFPNADQFSLDGLFLGPGIYDLPPHCPVHVIGHGKRKHLAYRFAYPVDLYFEPWRYSGLGYTTRPPRIIKSQLLKPRDKWEGWDFVNNRHRGSVVGTAEINIKGELE